MMRKLLLLSILCLSATLAFAQAKFTVNVSSDSILLGNRIKVTFTLENARANAFDPPTFEGLQVVGGPNQSSNYSIINGKVNQSQSYSFYLKPQEVGVFYIDPASVELDNEILETEPVPIKVVPNPDGIITQPEQQQRHPFFSFPEPQQPPTPKKKPKKKRRIYRL